MPELESLGSVPFAVVAVVLLLTAAAGLGGLMLPRLAGEGVRRCDVALLQVVVGLNLVGLLGLALGVTGGLASGRSVWLLGGGSLLLAAAVWRRRRSSVSPTHGRRLGQAPGLLWLGFVVLAGITLGPALCCPTGWDEQVYHCVLPRRWLAEGWPAVYLDLPYSGFPSLGEILFWLMAPIDSVIAPRLLVWVCWVLGLVCLYRVLRRRLASPAAGILTFAFVLNDTVLLICADCYVETVLLMNVAGILLAVELPRRRAPDAWARWGRAAGLGVMAGGAAAVKLTGCAVLAVPCLWYLGEAWRDRQRWRAVVGPMALSVGIAVAVGLPFYLRSWLATGNPFYPYLCEWFTDDPGGIEMSRFHHAIGGFVYGVKSVAAFVAAPLLLAFRSNNYDGEFGWQLLALVVFAVVAVGSAGRERVRRVVLWPAAVTVWLYVFWFVTAQQARFAVSALLAFMLVAAAGLQLLRGWGRRIALGVVVMAALASAPWYRSGYYWYSWLCVAGRVSRTDYVHTATSGVYLPLVQAVTERTPPDARLLLLLEHRSLYLPRWSRIGTPLFQEAFFAPVSGFTDVESVMNVLLKNSFTHVVLAKAPAGPDQAPGATEQRQSFVQAIGRCAQSGRLHLVWESKEYALLEVRR